MNPKAMNTRTLFVKKTGKSYTILPRRSSRTTRVAGIPQVGKHCYEQCEYIYRLLSLHNTRHFA